MLFDIVTVWSILIIRLLPTCTFMQQASLAITTCLIFLYSIVLHQKIKLQNIVNFQISECLTSSCTFYVFMFVCISGLEQRYGLLLKRVNGNSYKKSINQMTKEYGMHSERLVKYSTETKCASSAIHEHIWWLIKFKFILFSVVRH